MNRKKLIIPRFDFTLTNAPFEEGQKGCYAGCLSICGACMAVILRRSIRFVGEKIKETLRSVGAQPERWCTYGTPLSFVFNSYKAVVPKGHCFSFGPWGAVLLFFLLALSACEKDNTTKVPDTLKGVYITNEGGYMFGQGEVSFYDPAKEEVSNGLFKQANNYMLGDVAQSMYVKDTLGFIVVNNSAKIEVVSLPGMKRVRTINIPGSSPRYFMAINDSIAYVTELYASKVFVINYQSGEVVKSIGSLAQWTEHMLRFDNYVLVEERNLDESPSSTSSIVKISTANHSFVQRYTYTGSNLNGMVEDKNGRIWLAVEQDSVNSIPPKLYCLNTDMSVNKTIDFPLGHHFSCLSINGAGDGLYFFDDGLQKLKITDTDAPSAPFIARDGRNFYALGIHPVSGDIYISDALDYIQSSRIYRYDKNGQQLHSFTAGIISGNFTFRYE